MIYDKLENIHSYLGISENIKAALLYLQKMDHTIDIGSYQITSSVKVIVSVYKTQIENSHGYESHRKFIDIQYLIYGEERISYLPIENLKETVSYNSEEDIIFYESLATPIDLLIGNEYFAILFPQDGHMPQICHGVPEYVKKVVIKVEI